jgi:hypothetical protein
MAKSRARNVGYESEVLRSVMRDEEHDRLIVDMDRELRDERGYEIRDDVYGKNGVELETNWLVPYGKKVARRSPDEVPEIKDDAKALSNALEQNMLRSLYYAPPHLDAQWLPQSREWLRTLHGKICQRLRAIPEFRDLTISPDIVDRMVKPVVCLQTSMDFHRGTDMLFVFHDPAKFDAARRQKFKATNGEEALYFNPESDTVVTLDITASLDTKRDRNERRGRMARADVFASKVGSEANDGLKQFVKPTGFKTSVQDQDQRLDHLARLVVEMFLAKREHKIPHLRDPEAEKAERIRLEQAATRQRAVEAAATRREKKERSEEQSRIARERKATNTEVNKALDPRRQRKAGGGQPPKKKKKK